MEYKTTKICTDPLVIIKVAMAHIAINKIPFFCTNLLESELKDFGIHSSDAMLATTFGPAKNPALAATINNPASKIKTIGTTNLPS